MSLCETSGIAIFAAVCLLGETAGSAHAQFFATEWSGGKVINLGPGVATSINDAGQAVGSGPGGATEWSGGKVINLGGDFATSINDAGQVVRKGGANATEWS